MARPSTSAQRIWQTLILLSRANRLSVGLAFLLTVSAVVGLALTPGCQIGYQPKGLHRLVSTLHLFQAFSSDSSQPPPLIWQRRLGVNPAATIWKRLGQGIWWQGWSADGQPFLVLPANLVTAEERTRGIAHELDDLVVFSADALNRQHLRERLASTSSDGGLLSPLLFRCLQRLAREPSVVWQPEALDRFSGASAPLLQSAAHGCVSLRISHGHLQWQGEIGSLELGAAPPHLKPSGKWFAEIVDSPKQTSQSTNALLMMEGEQLGVLLSSLVSREIIQRPLKQTYALGAVQLTRLLQRPFRLRMLPQPKRSFKAGLQFQLWPQAERDSIDRSLQVLRGRLRDQGLNASGSNSVIWQASDPKDQAVIGGWRWLQPQSDRPVISLGLGISPSPQPLPRWSDALAKNDILLDLQARPAELISVGLLNSHWPQVVKQAQTLSLRIFKLSSSRESSPWRELTGQLELAGAGES